MFSYIGPILKLIVMSPKLEFEIINQYDDMENGFQNLIDVE